jgi:hypothetical protein
MSSDGRVSAVEVKSLFAAGIDAVTDQAAVLDDAGWDSKACGSWTATETIRHLLAVSRWYHAWLDRALAGDTTRPFDGRDIDQHNETELARLSEMAPDEATGQFAASAAHYLNRLDAHWDVPYAYPFGVVTAGLHAGVAATEWHLHAWDLSTVIGRPHVPNDPQRLFLAAGRCVAAAHGGLKGALLARAVPLAARRDPWQTLLKRSGRAPGS